MLDKAIFDELRDLKNMVAVYSNEYELPKEVVQDLNRRIESIIFILQETHEDARESWQTVL